MFKQKVMLCAKITGLLITCAVGVVSIIASSEFPPFQATISGTATKGPIDGGTVNAYEIDYTGKKSNLLGTATTASDGSFTLDISSSTTSIIIEVSGGTYINEATNLTATNSLLRAALTNLISGTLTTQVTPLTEMAVQIAETTTGIDVDKIDAANTLMSNLIGGADILTTQPANVLSSDASSATPAEQRYGLALASISQIAYNQGTDITMAINSIATDLADNKMLDTTGSDFSQALTNFTNSGNNHASTESADELAALVTAYAKSTVPNLTFNMGDMYGIWHQVELTTSTVSGADANIVNAGIIELHYNNAYTDTCLFTSEGACNSQESGNGFFITSTGYIPALNLAPNESDYSYLSAGQSLMADLHVDTTDQWQKLSVAVKRATSYSQTDLEGSWVSIALRSPVAGGSANDHGFSIESIDLTAHGSGTATCIANSAGCGAPSTFSGVTINNQGFITLPTDTGVTEIAALSADKNVIAQILKASADQQINIIVRKANNYSMAELVGTWVRLAFRTPLDADHNSVAVGDYGFDVGTLILNTDGTFTYNCNGRSGNGPCGTMTGAISGIGVCNITEPLQPGTSECGIVSKGKDVIVTMTINKDSEYQELSILLKRGDLNGSVGTTYNFADYIPNSTQIGCNSTYQFTQGTNAGNQFNGKVVNTTSVPYISGAINGITTEHRDTLDKLLNTYITSNDGTTVRYLGYNGYYIAKDCALSAPAPQFAFTTMYDNMIIDQTAMTHQVNAGNTSDCISEPGNQKLLVKVQDVTIPSNTYSNAIITYYLDTNYQFTPMNYSSQAAAYGITLPTGFDTGGASVTAFNIYAAGIGEIIGGDVDAASGTVNDPYELVSQTCP